MTYVSETSLTAIWHNIIQDIYIRLLLTYFFDKKFHMGHLEVWKIKFLAINKKINWYTDSFLYECTQAFISSLLYTTLECISHNQKRKYNPITDEARKERCLRKQPQTTKIYKSFKYMECINLVMVKIFSLSNIFMPQSNVSSNH